MGNKDHLYAIADQMQERPSGPFPVRYLNEPPKPTKWIIPGLVAAGTCGIMAAEPKAGKTWLTFGMGISLATGRSILGEFTPKATGKTLLYSPEGGWQSRTQRLWGLCWGEQIDPRLVISEMPFVDARLDLVNGIDDVRLAETIDEINPSLVVIDPLVAAHIGLDENSSGDVMRVLNPLRDIITARPDCALLVVHHHGKGKQSTLNHGLRGSSALGGWWDTLITIRRESDESDSPRRVDIEHRDAPPPQPLGFELAMGPSEEHRDLYWFRLDRCETPEMGSGGGAKANKARKDHDRQRVLNFVLEHSGQFSKTAGAGLLEMHKNTFSDRFDELQAKGLVGLEGNSPKTMKMVSL